jgi:hypothetical protein
MKSKTTKLGRCLCCLAIAQVAYYLISYRSDLRNITFYFDPRIGWTFFESFVRGRDVFPSAYSLVSAMMLFGMGWLLFHNFMSVKWYLLLEVLMALPSVVLMSVALFARMNSVHGFSASELLAPVTIFCLFTLFPLVWAVSLLRSEFQNLKRGVQ